MPLLLGIFVGIAIVYLILRRKNKPATAQSSAQPNVQEETSHTCTCSCHQASAE